ncbi:hypothetical protein D3C72_2553320 [compost metagenome]
MYNEVRRLSSCREIRIHYVINNEVNDMPEMKEINEKLDELLRYIVQKLYLEETSEG